MVLVTIKYSAPGTLPPIYVAGSFSNPEWQPREMQFTTDERNEHEFSINVDVEEGKEYQYKFRIGDGNWWILDEGQPSVTDDAGNRNNFVKIPPRQEQLKEIVETDRAAPFIPLADESLGQSTSEGSTEAAPQDDLASSTLQTGQYDGVVDDPDIKSPLSAETEVLTPSDPSVRNDQETQLNKPSAENGFMREKYSKTQNRLTGTNDQSRESLREEAGFSSQEESFTQDGPFENEELLERDTSREDGSNLTSGQKKNTEDASDQPPVGSTRLNPVIQSTEDSFLLSFPKAATSTNNVGTGIKAQISETLGNGSTKPEYSKSRVSKVSTDVDSGEAGQEADEIVDSSQAVEPQEQESQVVASISAKAFQETDDAGNSSSLISSQVDVAEAVTRTSVDSLEGRDLPTNPVGEVNAESILDNTNSSHGADHAIISNKDTNGHGIGKQTDEIGTFDVESSLYQSFDGTSADPLPTTPLVTGSRQLEHNTSHFQEISTGVEGPEIIVQPATPGAERIFPLASSKSLESATSTAVKDDDASSQIKKRGIPASDRAVSPNSVRTVGRDPKPKKFFKVFMDLVFVDWVGKWIRKLWTGLRRQPPNDKLRVGVICVTAVAAYLLLYGF